MNAQTGAKSGADLSEKSREKFRALVVRKYGGSSLADPQQIKDIANQVHNLVRAGRRVVLVVSAMGKTTDQLIGLAAEISPQPNRRELDMLLSAGERISMALTSMAINDAGSHAVSFTGSQAGVITDDSHSNACIVDVRPHRVAAEIEQGHVVVIAGFQGVTAESKEVTTLGRGGSDTTAIALAAHFKSECCEILKDVDGVYSADPRIVKHARHLPHLSYQELLEMTFAGAKVLHYRSVELAALLRVPIRIALAHPTSASENSIPRATSITGESPMYEKHQILSINSHAEVLALTGTGLGPAMALDALGELLHENSLPWPLLLDTSTHKLDTTFLITGPAENLAVLKRALKMHMTRLKLTSDKLATVTATCQGSYMAQDTKKLTQALGHAGVEASKIMFSAMSVTFVLPAEKRETAINALHHLVEKSL